MPSAANPKSKTKQIVAKPQPEWEHEFVAFKEICRRNGLSMSKEVYNRAIKSFLRDHNWPPGNSQTLLESFNNKSFKKMKDLCEMEGCNRKAESLCFSAYPFGKDRKLCGMHTTDEKRRHNIRDSKKL